MVHEVLGLREPKGQTSLLIPRQWVEPLQDETMVSNLTKFPFSRLSVMASSVLAVILHPYVSLIQ